MPFHLDGAFAPIAAAFSWCGTPAYSIPALLFLTGLVGGVAHCGPMCGPFVLIQAATIPAGLPMLRRLTGALLLPYHLGRLITYSVLGALAASVGAAIVGAAPVRIALAALLFGAALLFAAQAAVRFGASMPRGWADAISTRWASGLARIAQSLLDNPSPARRLALGSVLGLLPCGFLYAALAAAAATLRPVDGALGMAAFGLGTVPSLFLVGIGAASLAARWRVLARRALAPLFLFNAVVLSGWAVSLAVSS